MWVFHHCLWVFHCACVRPLPVLYANLSVCFVYWPVRQECCRQTFSSLRLQYHHFTMGNKSWNLKSYQKSSQLQPLVNWIVHPLHHLSSNRSIIHRGEKLPLPIWVLSISTLKRSKAWKAEKIQRAKAWKVQQRKRFESFSVLQLPWTYKHQLLNSIWSTVHTIPDRADLCISKVYLIEIKFGTWYQQCIRYHQ